MPKSLKIVVTGPESTAKSTLSEKLADFFNGRFYPEYARLYLDEFGASYDYKDVEKIAKGQIEQYQKSVLSDLKFHFFDTWLIITKVWFEWVYQKSPSWLEDVIQKHPINFYLLCKPDIPWEPDPLREHGGEERIQLFEVYQQELINRNVKFVVIDGIGEQRVQNAINAVLEFQKTIR